MADGFTTPVSANTKFASKDLGSAGHLPLSGLADQTGADAIGTADASPGANTLLGRLKSIYDAIVARLPTVGAKAASGSVSVTPATDGFAVSTDAGSASTATAVVKSDTTNLVMRGLYVGTAGDVVATVGGNDVTFKNVPAGTTLAVKATRIKVATTASDMIALA